MEKILDKTDYAILSCLKKNARMKASDIAKEINLSVSAILERIKKMEGAGVIESYTITLNQKILGNDLTALMDVSLEHPKYYDSFVSAVGKIESIQSCYYLTGKHDFLLKIICESSESLERIHRQIKCMEGVGSTETHFVLKAVKKEASSLGEYEDYEKIGKNVK